MTRTGYDVRISALFRRGGDHPALVGGEEVDHDHGTQTLQRPDRRSRQGVRRTEGYRQPAQSKTGGDAPDAGRNLPRDRRQAQQADHPLGNILLLAYDNPFHQDRMIGQLHRVRKMQIEKLCASIDSGTKKERYIWPT